MLTAAAIALTLAAHAPVVVHDSRERSLLTSVASAPVAVPGLDVDPRPAVYGRVAPAAGGSTWLQYWLFYASNDQDRGIVRSGRHAGDWEMVQVRIDPRGRPLEAVYSQHSGAERCSWDVVRRRGSHPTVYAANGGTRPSGRRLRNRAAGAIRRHGPTTRAHVAAAATRSASATGARTPSAAARRAWPA